MAVHIFAVNEENYEICIRRGLVGLPKPNDTRMKDNVFDALLSRIVCIKENDYILLYVIGKKELRGIWKADGPAFYEETKVWADDKCYPFRCRLKASEFYFKQPLKLNDINDMCNSGKIWTWALQRPSGSNAMFSISDYEFDIILKEYLKINAFSLNRCIIAEPYPYHEFNILPFIHTTQSLKYEYSVMTHLNYGFSTGNFRDIFGEYSDFLCYVPTSLGKEMDIMLLYHDPYEKSKKSVLSYDIIEVKRDVFDEKALNQLIGYETWFLHKKVSGDMNMIRVTAIAKSFDSAVVDYVRRRETIENKIIKLVEYSYSEKGGFTLKQIQ